MSYSSGISKAATCCGLLHCVSDLLVKILLSKQGKISVIQGHFFEGCGCANVANLDRIPGPLQRGVFRYSPSLIFDRAAIHPWIVYFIYNCGADRSPALYKSL